MQEELFFVFDVESIGLFGEAFAVGFTVVNRNGDERFAGLGYCSPARASGEDMDRQWVEENIPLDSIKEQATTMLLMPRQMRDYFWECWTQAAHRGASMWAECAWPVEACFLLDCITDDKTRENPYPLHDIASAVYAAGGEPNATRERQPHELPVHNPLADARQSARILLESLNWVNARQDAREGKTS